MRQNKIQWPYGGFEITKVFFYYSTVKLPETAEVWKCKPVFIDRTYEIR